MGYRENVVNAIQTDLTHPYNKGVKMQAHHLISKKAVKLGNLKSDLEHLGYDINVKENVALIPSTLKGACHLKTQVHRGNHTAPGEGTLYGDGNDDDDLHGIGYHLAVRAALQRVKIKRDRGRLCLEPGRDIQKEIDAISVVIAGALNLYTMKLWAIADSFKPTASSGCCNETSVPVAAELLDAANAGGAAVTCDDNRNHKGDEGITYTSLGVYVLRTGR